MDKAPWLERFGTWCARKMPTRETFERIGWLRPIAHRILRPDLWRFSRRSVPRGVALGVIVGVLVPVAQTVFAALFALPARANVPVAAVTTFITNPLTTPAIWVFAHWVGARLLRIDQAATGGAIGEHFAGQPEGWAGRLSDWVSWLVYDVGPALGLGLVVVATVGAAIGYLLAAWGWRWWIGRKWRRRRAARAA